MIEPMLEFRNVSKAYPLKKGKKIILKNVSFKIPKGQSLGILGVNGAGKSTLLRLIAGSEFADSGQIIRKGHFSWPLGFSGGFNGSLSGIDNLRFVCRIYNADFKRVVEYVKDFSELGNFIDEPIKTYSSGMKARLAFSLSMAIDFDVYLVDEILGVGDQGFQKKCREAFNQKRGNSSIIMVSHSMDTIKQYGDKAILMTDSDIEIHDDVSYAISLYQDISSGSAKASKQP